MAELIKNYRFRTGSMVDIYHTPVFQGNTIDFLDTSFGGTWTVLATFDNSLAAENFGVGDIAAFGFGVGEIVQKNSNSISVSFPKSMFPDSDVMKYVGSEYQHTMVFSASSKIEAGYKVQRYLENVKQASYGYAKTVYNLQTEADLLLVPLRMVDDGVLNRIMYSKGFVLKSCNTEDYDVTTSFDTEFPIELSGTSIDPIYRRAYLLERKSEHSSRRSKATLKFRLIG